MNTLQMLRPSATVKGFMQNLRKLSEVTAELARRKAIEKYLAAHEIKKLHLGAGLSTIPTWLATDLMPSSDEIIFLDATKRFPFPDGTFDYVFSEHMIEHLPWHKGLFMLKECRRVLKPGGTLRVATPDLEILLGLYKRDEAPLHAEYIRWITDLFILPYIPFKDERAYRSSIVINNAFRNWGHQFLYDGELLSTTMQEAGFINIRRVAYGQSEDEHLRGLESHGSIMGNDKLVSFETMIFEATRPV
ncbi:class I SAM-dependent methyltransferase [Candidatus Methylocalor cossyra]|uniref:Predicted SAM-depedendent methyltransferase n=1 Tax=Candidatus Methylocalor cossyra TaxID=3108543 RepID=A0ABM9NMK2_9GAMM